MIIDKVVACGAIMTEFRMGEVGSKADIACGVVHGDGVADNIAGLRVKTPIALAIKVMIHICVIELSGSVGIDHTHMLPLQNVQTMG